MPNLYHELCSRAGGHLTPKSKKSAIPSFEEDENPVPKKFHRLCPAIGYTNEALYTLDDASKWNLPSM